MPADRLDVDLFAHPCTEAASVLEQVSAGERASAALGARIARGRLNAERAELLSGLVYGVLRCERRLDEALREAANGQAATEQASGWLQKAVAVALLERRANLDAQTARGLVAGVAWERLSQANQAVLARADPLRRVALSGSLPDWLSACLLREYGQEAEPLAASLSEPAPRSLRANALVTGVAELRARLQAEGARVREGASAKRALRIEGAFNPFVTRAFHEGAFELQDEGSQLVCELVAPPPRGLVVDACAGAGGKTLALAAALEGRGKVLALDVDARKLSELRKRAKRAGAANVQPLLLEESGPFPAAAAAALGRVDRLLVDAPCSGTGVLRRNPEVRRLLSPDAVARLAATQLEIVERMLPLLSAGGRLIFATCSLLREEGEDVMDAIEAAHSELVPVDLAEVYDRAYVDRFVRSAPHRLRLFPHLHGTDGFFIGCLRKRRT